MDGTIQYVLEQLISTKQRITELERMLEEEQERAQSLQLELKNLKKALGVEKRDESSSPK